VLIIGGSGEYLDLADNVYLMKDYFIFNYNREVAETKQNTFEFFTVHDGGPVKWRPERTILKESMVMLKKDEEANRLREFVSVDDEKINVGINKANISRLDTVISRQQRTAIAFIIRSLFNSQADEKCRLLERLRSIYDSIREGGFGEIYSAAFGVDFNMELPAMHDILFAISRMDNIVYACENEKDMI